MFMTSDPSEYVNALTEAIDAMPEGQNRSRLRELAVFAHKLSLDQAQRDFVAAIYADSTAYLPDDDDNEALLETTATFTDGPESQLDMQTGMLSVMDDDEDDFNEEDLCDAGSCAYCDSVRGITPGDMLHIEEGVVNAESLTALETLVNVGRAVLNTDQNPLQGALSEEEVEAGLAAFDEIIKALIAMENGYVVGGSEDFTITE